jgi:aryl-alcohol dehydrogenase-like predicted oxidoreductase
MAFAIAHPVVTSALIGPRTMEQLDDLLAGIGDEAQAAEGIA